MDISRLEALEHALWEIIDEYKAGNIKSPADAKRRISGLLGTIKDTSQVYGRIELFRRFVFGSTVKLRVSSSQPLNKLLKLVDVATFGSGATAVGLRWIEGEISVLYVVIRVKRYKQLLQYITALGDSCEV